MYAILFVLLLLLHKFIEEPINIDYYSYYGNPAIKIEFENHGIDEDTLINNVINTSLFDCDDSNSLFFQTINSILHNQSKEMHCISQNILFNDMSLR